VSETTRPLHVMRAVQTMLDMFALVLRRLTELTSDVLRDKQQLLPLREDLRALLAAAKVWSDWMLGHLVLWNPPPQLPPADARFILKSKLMCTLTLLLKLLKFRPNEAFTYIVCVCVLRILCVCLQLANC
jgi:hypothetical protein